MSRIIKQDSMFRIEENENYEPGKGNVFLMITFNGPKGMTDKCIGGADDGPGRDWEVTISAPYDQELDSDADCVGKCKTQQEAIEILWNHRHQAYIW